MSLRWATGRLSTWQTLRQAKREAPRWSTFVVAGAVGLLLGALLTATIAAAPSVGAGCAAAMVAVGAVHMTAVGFASTTAVVAKGGMLRLVDDGNYIHIFRNGSWDGTTARPTAEPGAPVVNDVMITHGSVDIGPFNTAGTFHIYCTVHPGMSLTIIVP
jgi:hypothetical protein